MVRWAAAACVRCWCLTLVSPDLLSTVLSPGVILGVAVMPAAALWPPSDDDIDAQRRETDDAAAAASSPLSSSSTSASARRLDLPSLLLVPPLRYELVEERLHRGAYPTLRNFPFLARLRLKTIVCLIPEPPSADLAEFAQREGITLHHFPTLQHVDSITLTAATVSSALSVMIAIEHLPLYLHCLDGLHSTGLVVAMLRHLQYRASAAVLEEYARFGAEVTEEVVDRLQRWQDSELTVRIPTNLPHWLWEGKHVIEHPTMRIDDASMRRRGDGAAGGAGAAAGGSDKKKTKAVTAAQRADDERKEKTQEEQHNGERTALPHPAKHPRLALAAASDFAAVVCSLAGVSLGPAAELAALRHAPAAAVRSQAVHLTPRRQRGALHRGRSSSRPVRLPRGAGTGRIHYDQHLRLLSSTRH